jgi:hypothetical protein
VIKISNLSLTSVRPAVVSNWILRSRGSCPIEKGRLTSRQPREDLVLAQTGMRDSRLVAVALGVLIREESADAVQHSQWTGTCNMFQRMAPAQGCSGSSSSIWGERGTAQASQCNAVALPGGFPERRHGQQPPSDAACRNCWNSRTSTNAVLVVERNRVCSQLAAKAAGPFFKGAAVPSGARPVWKTIIHVLLALSSSTLDLLRFKFPPYTAPTATS